MSGIIAIKLGFSELYYLAGIFVLLGAFFDFFDGFVARLLGVQGEIGKQLDSLADMVTFGVAPGVVMYSFLKFYYVDIAWSNLAFLIPLLSAVRLARFNIDTNQSDKFIGLPTPANALFFVFIPVMVIILEHPKFLFIDLLAQEYSIKYHMTLSVLPSEMPHAEMMDLKYLILGLIAVFSLLLNAPIEMLALKFKSFGWKGNEVRYSFLVLALVIILITMFINSVVIAVPIIILLYIVISLLNNAFKKTKNEI